MRRLIPSLLLLFSATAAAQDDFEATRRLAAAGAAQLALARVEHMQPQRDDAPWAEWEALRLDLLAQLGRNRELLERAADLPDGSPENLLRQAWRLSAQSAAADGQNALARDCLARLLWRFDLSEEEQKQVRMQVIDSHLAGKKAGAAYGLMLRYQQDYPLDKAAAGKFTLALLENGMEQEAAGWLKRLDEGTPVKLLLRFRTGLLDADAAVRQARAGWLASGDSAYLKILLHAASRRNDPALTVEALENLAGADDGAAEELWRAYLSAAPEIGNRNQLLAGDDAAWLDLAADLPARDAPSARALLAHLSVRAQSQETRRSAQKQFSAALVRAGLGMAALRLFGDEARFAPDALPVETRHALGRAAFEQGAYEFSARFWQGLEAPPGVAPEEWRLRLAYALLRAGRLAESADVLREAPPQELPGKLARRQALALEILEEGDAQAARPLLAALLPHGDAGQRRELLFALGRAAEEQNDFAGAADYFLQAVALLENKSDDALAREARLRGAAALARAGYRQDAAAQYRWLMKNSPDAAQQRAARHGLQQLP